MSAGVGQQAVEQLAVVGIAKLIGLLLFQTVRKCRVGFQVVADVAAPPLDEEPSQVFPLFAVVIAGKIAGQGGELGVQQPEQRAEAFFVAGVRRGGDQHDVAIGIGGQGFHDLVPLLPRPATAWLRLGGAGLGLVHDDQFGAGSDEVVATRFALDVVQGHHYEGKHVEDATVAAIAVEAPGGAGEHQFGFDMKLLPQLILPLFGQMGWAEHG